MRKAHGRIFFRWLLRMLGYATLTLGTVALAFDLWSWRGVGTLSFDSTYDWWGTLHPESLGQFSSFVRGLSQWLWESAVSPALRWPAFATLGAASFISWILGRRPRGY